LLRPSRLTNHIVEYCLATAAEDTGVVLHAACFMSNHWHGVVTDPEARLPEFLERFHRLVAKAQNASLGRWENFWSSHKTSVVLLVDDQDVLDKMAYTLANPTIAGLVRSPSEWPGVIASPCTKPRVIGMPDVYFDQDGELEDEVLLRFERPKVFLGLRDDEFAIKLSECVAQRVRDARDEMGRRGLQFIGTNAVLRQPFWESPKTTAQHRNPSPRIAAKSSPARIKAIERLLSFMRSYRDAWLLRRAGDHSVCFPPGTYALRIYAGVTCSPWIPH
jgi:putative transposase